MASVWSTRLFSVRLATASNWVTVLQVPTGYRAVLKFVGTTQAFATGALVALALSSNGFELYRAVADSNSRSSNPVTITLHEGEVLLGRAYVNQADVSASGYLLQGPGGPLSTPSIGVLPGWEDLPHGGTPPPGLLG